VTDKHLSRDRTFAAAQLVKEKEYWSKQLSGEFERSYFLHDYKKNYKKKHSEAGSKEPVTFNLGPELYARSMDISGDSLPTLHMILTAALVALAAVYSGHEDIIIGTPVDRQDTMDSLVNTILPLRVRLDGGMTFKQLLLEVRKTINEAIENQNYPVESLAAQLNGTQPGSDVPLFDTALLLENLQDKTYIQHIDTGILFSFRAKTGSIEGELEYHAHRYEQKSIRRIADHFLRLLRETLFDVERKIEDLQLLSEEDKKRFAAFNNTRVSYPAPQSIHELFARQAARTPDNIAIKEMNGTRTLTYQELNHSANRLAADLEAKGVGAGSIVGIAAERSCAAITAILGVLKTGGAYLPIDTDFPEERKNYMLKHSGARFLLSVAGNRIDCSEPETGPGTASEAVPAGVENLAYVIYTSGSTGKPKGVMVRHQSLVNYIQGAAAHYVKKENVNFPLFTSLAFDLTITSIFTPLITGNSILVYGGWEEGNLIEKIIDDNQAGVIKLTPSHLNLIRYKRLEGKTSLLKRFIVGGEKLETQLAHDVYRNFNRDIQIYNEYGPTEATVGCMIYEFNPEKDHGFSIPIGKPQDNVQVYLLNGNRQPVPIGAVGEIYIAGAGVAAGYLKGPELTAEKFVPNPFLEGSVMYRTGDLARWLDRDSLDIEFLGRRDFQVKFRGFRIELGEIENGLLEHEDVKEAVVIVLDKKAAEKDSHDNEENHLCAYFVSDRKLSVEELRQYLYGKLPHYMLPSYFVQVEAIPLTPHGKVDIRLLPEPPGLTRIGVEYHAPATENEKVLAGIWQDVLGIDKIGIDEPYFALGGDSINAIQIAARLQKFKLKLELKYLYQYPTIRQLAQYVKSMKEVPYQGVVAGEVKLTPIQHWFFEKSCPEAHHFNQSVMLFRQEGFNGKILEEVFHKLAEHHDALRMVFKQEGNQIKQINRGLSGDLIDLSIFDIKEEPAYEKLIEEKCNQIQRGMDLNNGPLLKLGLFKTAGGDYLLIAIHHLVIDGVSWRILFEDFAAFYKHLEKGGPLEDMAIPLKTTPYREWAEKLSEYANGKELLDEWHYWKKFEEMEDCPLPGKGTSRDGQCKDKKTISFELSAEDTQKLLKEVNQAYNTGIYDILLTALAASLNDWAGKGRNIIALEGHGREEISEDLDLTRTIGWFTTLYPVLLDIKDPDDIPAMIKDTKEMLRKIPGKGLGYGALKYLTAPGNRRGMSFNLKPGIGFNYLGQFDEGINTDLFQPADLSPGASISLNWQSEYALELVGMITGNTLKMSVNFYKEEFSEKKISAFVNQYKIRLRQILGHCLEKEETELTLSDFSTSIEEEEAEFMFDILSEITLDEGN
jgi:amino acid adenylation domain-containing protein/non-ribosomal peptide synthase protein (TIGR01720 family)